MDRIMVLTVAGIPSFVSLEINDHMPTVCTHHLFDGQSSDLHYYVHLSCAKGAIRLFSGSSVVISVRSIPTLNLIPGVIGLYFFSAMTVYSLLLAFSYRQMAYS
ncbi:MAG: hypothetical protein R2788_27125 [Saprospiraceae bacterium]